MGCSESKEEVLLQYDYQRVLKNEAVLAAMLAVQIDFRDAGLRFYRVFARMDVDGSRSVDLDEFHAFFKLPRSRLSDQVFSALGHQNASRDVTFDDFVLNLWNFCTMSTDDIREAIFELYDDDRSGTLDFAECESLFRLLCNTNELSPTVKQIIAEVDANSDGMLDKDEHGVVETGAGHSGKTQQKCLGKRYWTKEKKKRVRILASQKNVFALAKERLTQEVQKSATEPVQPEKIQRTPSVEPRPVIHRASEVVASMQVRKEREEFDAWILAQQQDNPNIDQYLKAFSEVHVTKAHVVQLSTATTHSSTGEGMQLLADLRYHLAVSEKRLDEAKAKVMKQWGDEESSMRDARHEIVRANMNILTPGALLKHAGKDDGPSTLGTYLQKKLDAATAEVHTQFQQRWDKLERACVLLVDRAVAVAPTPLERIQQKKATDRRQPTANSKSPTRVIPVTPVTETWTKMFDTTHNRPYYVSSTGISTWERPETFISK